MENWDLLARINHLLVVCDQLKNAYFWHAPTSAGGRRSLERGYGVPTIEWSEGGHSYSAAVQVDCSCHHVYVVKLFYRDGVKPQLQLFAIALIDYAKRWSNYGYEIIQMVPRYHYHE